MATIAYASGNPAPIAFPDVDPLFNESVGLPHVVTLHGGITDSTDGAPTGAWSWTILDNDPSSPAVLSADNVQSPTLTVNTWRNVRLMLIVTNTNNGTVSEADPLLCPNSAFVEVRVESLTSAIEKVAEGSRDYTGALHKWADVIELNANGVGAHNIASHTDTAATGGQLNTLVGGASATGLHTHAGTDVPLATTLTRGTVLLEETGTGTGKVVTRERVSFSGSFDGSWADDGAGGWQRFDRDIVEWDINLGVVAVKPLSVWFVKESVNVVDWACSMVKGGLTSPHTDYLFKLYTATAALAATDTWAYTGHSLTGFPAVDNDPLLLASTLGAPFILAAGSYLAVMCTASPFGVSAGDGGSGLTVQINCRRDV